MSSSPSPSPGASRSRDLDVAADIEKQSRYPAAWPPRPQQFPELMRPIEAAQYLRLDETGIHTPAKAVRTLGYWRDRGQLKATKYARHVWYRKIELDRFLAAKTES